MLLWSELGSHSQLYMHLTLTCDITSLSLLLSSLYHKIALAFCEPYFPLWRFREIFVMIALRLKHSACVLWEYTYILGMCFGRCLIRLWAVREVKANAAYMQIRPRRMEQKRLQFTLAGFFFTQFRQQKTRAQQYMLPSSITSETQSPWCVRKDERHDSRW